MKSIIALWMLSISISLNAQTNDKAIEIEFFGPGWYNNIRGLPVVEFDYVLYKKNNISYYAQLGLGVIKFRDFDLKFNPDMVLPISLGVCVGKKLQPDFRLGVFYSNTVVLDESFNKKRNSNFSSFVSPGIKWMFLNHCGTKLCGNVLWDFKQNIELGGSVSFLYTWK
ncbi:MAG: hypothetical protein U0U66_14890 [Cytophagaceae bacterium]